MSDLTPPPIDKPEIVIPDAGPLIHLAQANLLHLLHEAGGAVVVVDMVAHEVTRDLSKPGAAALHAWMQDGLAPGSNAPVRVEDTETGRLFRIALRSEPDLKLRNGGETAIVEWLAEKVAGTDRAVIVLYENGRVPGVIRNQTMDADIDVLTTRAFLDAMQKRQAPLETTGSGSLRSARPRTPACSPTASAAGSPEPMPYGSARAAGRCRSSLRLEPAKLNPKRRSAPPVRVSSTEADRSRLEYPA